MGGWVGPRANLDAMVKRKVPVIQTIASNFNDRIIPANKETLTQTKLTQPSFISNMHPN
jgi:hypothetical protein